MFHLVGHAPEGDGEEGDAADEVLYAGEAVFHGPDGDNGGVFSGVEG